MTRESISSRVGVCCELLTSLTVESKLIFANPIPGSARVHWVILGSAPVGPRQQEVV